METDQYGLSSTGGNSLKHRAEHGKDAKRKIGYPAGEGYPKKGWLCSVIKAGGDTHTNTDRHTLTQRGERVAERSPAGLGEDVQDSARHTQDRGGTQAPCDGVGSADVDVVVQLAMAIK